MIQGHTDNGFSMVELLIALALSALVILATVRIATATSASFRMQQNLATLQENARYAFSGLQADIAQAGFTHRPWDSALLLPAVDAATFSGTSNTGDRLVLNRWSKKNCFENPNPVTDAAGIPAWYVLQKSYYISSGTFKLACGYGPDSGTLITQINGQSVVNSAMSFQLLFAEDSDDDQQADRWVKAGDWNGEQQLLAVKFGLILKTDQQLRVPAPGSEIHLLDTSISLPDDEHLYRSFVSLVPIEGRRR